MCVDKSAHHGAHVDEPKAREGFSQMPIDRRDIMRREVRQVGLNPRWRRKDRVTRQGDDRRPLHSRRTAESTKLAHGDFVFQFLRVSLRSSQPRSFVRHITGGSERCAAAALAGLFPAEVRQIIFQRGFSVKFPAASAYKNPKLDELADALRRESKLFANLCRRRFAQRLTIRLSNENIKPIYNYSM